jgi:hypothetical protein
LVENESKRKEKHGVFILDSFIIVVKNEDPMFLYCVTDNVDQCCCRTGGLNIQIPTRA